MAANISSVNLTGLTRTAQGQLEAVEMGRVHLQAATSHAETLGSSWTGDASSGFQNALTNFNDHGTKLLNSLQRMHELMLDTHSQFSGAHQETTEQAQQAAQMMAAAPQGLPGL